MSSINAHTSLGKRGCPSKSKMIDDKEIKCSKKRDRETAVSENIAEPGDFSHYPEIDPKTIQVLKTKGICSLFPIQQHCFKPVYERKDVIGRDLTGSGKTFAFALPLVEYLRANGLFGTGKVQAVMLAPTRELAIQITDEINKIKHDPGEFSVITVYGGVSVATQARQLKNGVDIFVGTCGRVKDHIERENIDFSDMKTLVLDEADVMLKMGFKEDIEEIMGKATEVCSKDDLQTLLFSATLPDWINEVAREFMKEDITVVDLAQDLTNKTSSKITHLALECAWYQKNEVINKLLNIYASETGKVIIFTATKKDANELGYGDTVEMYNEVMHGDISQNSRQSTINRFKSGKLQCVIATDVASRGLDVLGIDLVIQLEPPKDTESYIHRSGRTARAGKSGTCITLFNSKNEEFLTRAEDLAGITMERIEIPTDEDVDKAKEERAERQRLNPGKVEKSILTGTDCYLCLEMIKTDDEKNKIEELNKEAAYGLLQRYWAPRIVQSVKAMRSCEDGEGVVFDLGAQMADGFIESFLQLKQNFSRIDFEVSICKELPELKDPADDPDYELPEPEEPVPRDE